MAWLIDFQLLKWVSKPADSPGNALDVSEPRPNCVIVCHSWSGCSDIASLVTPTLDERASIVVRLTRPRLRLSSMVFAPTVT